MDALTRLTVEIEKVVAARNARFGVSVRFLGSGERVGVHAEDSFPLASVFKVPVLVAAVRQADAGRLSLQERLELRDEHRVSNVGVLPFMHPGLQPTIADLLTLMIIYSDNVAVDMVIERLGGVEAVAGEMRSLGFLAGEIEVLQTEMEWFRATYGERFFGTTPAEYMVIQSSPRFDLESACGRGSNTGTAAAMSRLFEMITLGTAASRAGCDFALKILRRQTMTGRLPSQLPVGAEAANKPGTIFGVRNDSGLLFAGERAVAAVTVLTRQSIEALRETAAGKGAPGEEGRIDQAIGKIGRLVYDHATAGAL